MVRSGTERVRRLRERAERALDRQRPDHELMRLLDELVDVAPHDSEDSLFAHRQLAELRLERHPWRAALHLKAILDRVGEDEGASALMGLCQALLGNYRSAAHAYRQALCLAPTNPWYHHNLGHLLDVGLGNQRAAIYHLRKAHELEPDEDEIGASLARCLAVLGAFEEADALVEDAVARAPDNEDHRALRSWIQRRAHGLDEADCDEASACAEVDRAEQRRRLNPGGSSCVDEAAERALDDFTNDLGVTPARSGTMSGSSGLSSSNVLPLNVASSGAVSSDVELTGGPCAVLGTLDVRMREAGFSPNAVRLAHTLWSDFQHRHKVRVGKPEVIAAAVEYALAKVQQVPGVTQAAVARRYGVAVGAVSSRYGQIRQALALQPRDPRYMARA